MDDRSRCNLLYNWPGTCPRPDTSVTIGLSSSNIVLQGNQQNRIGLITLFYMIGFSVLRRAKSHKRFFKPKFMDLKLTKPKMPVWDQNCCGTICQIFPPEISKLSCLSPAAADTLLGTWIWCQGACRLPPWWEWTLVLPGIRNRE